MVDCPLKSKRNKDSKKPFYSNELLVGKSEDTIGSRMILHEVSAVKNIYYVSENTHQFL